MRITLLTALGVFLFAESNAQDRGRTTYQFLDIPASARVTALGGSLITVKDNDPTLAADNPALLNKEMHNRLAVSYINYFAGINYGYSSYTHDHGKAGTMNAAVRYMSYGTFEEIDETGTKLGNFSAGEYALVLGWGKSLDSSFSVGANFKTIYSSLYTDYSSVALAVDLASTYTVPEKRFTLSLLVRNLGREVVSYRKGENEQLPFEVQAGISKQLPKMPVRFSLIAHNLNRADLRFDSPLDKDNSNFQVTDEEEQNNENTFVGNLFRHLIVNAEFIPSKNFNVRLGYNFNRRKEMIDDVKPATVGISWGLGLRISKFHISYGRSAYHLAGSPNHFTIVTNLSDFTGK